MIAPAKKPIGSAISSGAAKPNKSFTSFWCKRGCGTKNKLLNIDMLVFVAYTGNGKQHNVDMKLTDYAANEDANINSPYSCC